MKVPGKAAKPTTKDDRARAELLIVRWESLVKSSSISRCRCRDRCAFYIYIYIQCTSLSKWCSSSWFCCLPIPILSRSRDKGISSSYSSCWSSLPRSKSRAIISTSSSTRSIWSSWSSWFTWSIYGCWSSRWSSSWTSQLIKRIIIRMVCNRETPIEFEVTKEYTMRWVT